MHVSRMAVLAAAFSALAFTAQAVTVSLIDSSVQGPGNDADVYASNFAGHTPTGGNFSSNPLVTPPPGNEPGAFQSPFNNTPLVDTQSYFSVYSEFDGNGAPSPVTLTLGSPVDEFKILWGSLDDYNTIEFFSGATSLMSFTGEDIVNLFGLGGSAPNFERVALLNFGGFGDGATDEHPVRARPLRRSSSLSRSP